jgi:hypothetical protein
VLEAAGLPDQGLGFLLVGLRHFAGNINQGTTPEWHEVKPQLLAESWISLAG